LVDKLIVGETSNLLTWSTVFPETCSRLFIKKKKRTIQNTLVSVMCLFMGKFAEKVNLSDFHSQFQGEPFPYFQPIVSMEDRKVIGYEVLARGFNKLGKVATLGPLFQANEDANQLKKLDHFVREEACKKFSESGLVNDRKLFVNVMPQWLESEDGSEINTELPLLEQICEHYNIPAQSLVLEITEGEFSNAPQKMTAVANQLKSAGFNIALDDFGAGFSNMSRIGQLEPKYIKLDLNLIRRGFSESLYKEILNSMSYLSDKIGAILLVEGIEKQDELYGAMDIGARYIQGFFVGYPDENFQNEPIREGDLNEYLKDFRKHKIEHMRGLLSFQSMLADFFSTNLVERFKPLKKNDVWHLETDDISDLPDFWRHQLKMIYFMDFDGIQVSPNYANSINGLLSADDSFLGKDWSWRPYFLEFMAKKTVYGQDLSYSEPYRDIRIDETMVTMIYNYADEVILCTDLEIAELTDPLWHKKLTAKFA
jgi:EAL domain-containing protein (putative c-di-GMP-specific phosphodiesterase class I)